MNLISTDTPIEAAARDAVRGAVAYRAPALSPWIDLKLDANEGLPPPASVLDLNELITEGLVSRYPSAAGLEMRLADRLGVAADRVLVTAGGDDAIDRVCRARLGPGDVLLQPEPTFEMIGRYAKLAGAEVVGVPWSAGPFPTEAILSRISARTGVIAVVSPNNPTGLTTTSAALRRISHAAPRAVVLVDLAYAEFAEEDLTAAAAELGNAVIIRTFSKAWGLAGLRIGYAVGPAGFIGAMRAAGGPFAVSGVSIAAAARAMERGADWIAGRVRAVREQREALAAVLNSMGVSTSRSEANFILARSPRSTWVRQALASLGIAVRGYADGALLGDALRISCPGDGSTGRISHAIRAALRPGALLLSLDGVLTDVARSSRAGPGTSNPGENEVAGLGGPQDVIPDRDCLARLAARLPLGIVTARPRSEAEQFLERRGVRQFCSAMVCGEDGPRTPDPAAIRLAMSRLSVGEAWMAAGSADDIVAARAAGVVPIAIASPGTIARARTLLASFGPAEVLDGIEQLEELLPC